MPETKTMDWLIEAVGGDLSGALNQVWWAPPVETSDGRLVFAGYVPKGNSATRVRLYQKTALLAETTSAPGFSLSVPLVQALYQIELWQGDDRLGQWDVIPYEREVAALTGMVPLPASDQTAIDAGKPYAITGRMGELFLSGDSNDSVAQFTRPQALGAGCISAWRSTFDQFSDWQQQFKLNKISVLIAPAKEEILREFYPHSRASGTFLDQFMTQFQNRPIVLPKWELWNGRKFAYAATDTHWTDYGATVAAGAVLKSWDMAGAGLPDKFRMVRRIGDLGVKMEPRISGFEPMFPAEDKPVPIFDNGVSNQGCVRVWHTPDAPNPGSLLIFGDSFGTNLAEAFAGVFREVSYAYQPAGFDPELVSILRPQNVLLQITQRFIYGQPATGVRVLQKSRDKVLEMPEDKRTALRTRLADVDGRFRPLTEPLMD